MAKLLRRQFGIVSMAGWLFLVVASVAHAQTAGNEVAQPFALLAEARAYEHGEGVPKDATRAISFYCDAARLGNSEAQFSLGWMYANGRGVTRDDSLASFFFGLAAKQGHEYAQKMLRFTGDAVAETPECLREKPTEQEQSAQVQSTQGQTVAESLADLIAALRAPKEIAELVNQLAPEYGVSPRLALAVICAESNFNPAARSEKNAQGLMQLIPETAARFNVTKPFDPVQNVRGGLAYLRWLLSYFQGNVLLVAAAYNAGEGAVNRYLGIPPFAETRTYVKRIRDFFGRSEHPYDASVTERSPELHRMRAASHF